MFLNFYISIFNGCKEKSMSCYESEFSLYQSKLSDMQIYRKIKLIQIDITFS